MCECALFVLFQCFVSLFYFPVFICSFIEGEERERERENMKLSVSGVGRGREDLSIIRGRKENDQIIV